MWFADIIAINCQLQNRIHISNNFIRNPVKVMFISCIRRKEIYNQALDTRLLTLLVLNTDEAYTARAILDKLYRKENIIFLVWQEEQRELTEKRNALFQKGCEKFLAKFSAC